MISCKPNIITAYLQTIQKDNTFKSSQNLSELIPKTV